MNFFICVLCYGKTLVTLLLLLLDIVGCSPPQDPIKCSANNLNCTVTNSYAIFPDRSTCRAAQAVYPTTEEELISTVANATLNNTKMKVATRYSHSTPKLVCPDGDNGLLISTKYLNKVVKVDPTAHTMTVQSGVTLQQLIEEAAKAGLALAASPYWWGLTVGGMLGTGAHGSTLWGRGSAVHDYVVELRIVSPGGPEDGYVRVKTMNESDPDLDAAKVSLGVLGVISRVTFKLEPLFKRSMTFVPRDDDNLANEAIIFGKQHEFADISWYPSQRKVLYRIDDRVPSNTTGNGLYDFTGFRPTLSFALATIRSLEEDQESRKDAKGKCTGAKLLTSILEATAFGLTNNGISFTGYPVTGYHNRLQASGSCLKSEHDLLITACAWDPRIKGEFYLKTTVTIALSKAQDFIKDVQKLVSLEPKSLCGTELYNGILIRYVKASSAYLGKEKDGLDFDITYYRSKNPVIPRLYVDIIEEIEQMALFKYDGLPHWGKNQNLAYEGVIRKYKNGEEFLKVKEKLDPLRLFSSEWTDQILGGKIGPSILKNGCALEGLCICSQDVHCAPSMGYFCRQGRIYKEARVCTNRPDSKYYY